MAVMNMIQPKFGQNILKKESPTLQIVFPVIRPVRNMKAVEAVEVMTEAENLLEGSSNF